MLRPDRIMRGTMPSFGLSRGSIETDGLVRLGLALLFGLALATLAYAAAFGSVYAASRPDAVLALNPRQPVANMVRAERLLTDQPDPATIHAARAPAVEALRSQPLAPAALRLVALAAYLDRKEKQAEMVMQLAALTSKRDLTTNLWLIDRSVLNEDIAGALRFYNRALALEPEMGDVLFPILADAISDPNIYEPAKRILGKRPQWAGSFFGEVIDRPAATRAYARMLIDWNTRGDQLSRDQQQVLIETLADKGDTELAGRVYRLVTGRSARDLLRNGDFAGENDWPPFDWQLYDNARTETFAGDDGKGLILSIAGAQPRRIARQLVTLTPGARYRLAIDASVSPSEGPRIGGGEPRLEARVTCVAKGRGRIAEVVATPSAGRIGGGFAIPAGCATQWLTLYARGDDSRRTSEIAIRGIGIAAGG